MGSPEAVFFDRSLDTSNRHRLRWNADKAMGINADATNAAEATRDIVGQQFEILGTNAVSADCTLDTAGGVKLSAHSTTSDSTILLPHLTASMSAWTSTLWDTAKSPTFEATIMTPATVTLYTAWLGFKLTNTDNMATDADQVCFNVIAGTSTKWNYNWSIGASAKSVSIDTAICPALAASTVYKFRIEIYSDRTHMAFVNDKPIAANVFPALTSLTTFIPYIGVKSNTTAARTLTVKPGYECTRLY